MTNAVSLPPLFEAERPDWEISFTDESSAVMSVMPGESGKTFHDPLTNRSVKWEQDVFCPTFSVLNDELIGVYRAFGDDGEWRFGLAGSKDGVNFTRSEQPVLYAKRPGISYGDPHVIAGRDGNFYLFFGYFHFGNTTNDQELAVATSRDMRSWDVRGRVFAREAACDRAVIPERSPWRLCVATVISRLEGGRFVATKINGKYWMYFNCYATRGDYCLCVATSDDMLDWTVARDENGQLVHPLPARPGYFDSWYTDPVAAVVREDGILLIYNGVNQNPAAGGDPRRPYYAHYPAQALFDHNDPTRLLQRSESPFKGGDEALEKDPIVFWNAPLYEAWSLVAYRGELLLYWNHAFGRRSVGLWKAALPAGIRNVRSESPQRGGRSILLNT